MALVRNTATVTGLGFFGMVTGIVLDALIVGVFGLGIKTDAYFIASTIPLALITILYFQVGKVIQPYFIHLRSNEGEEVGWLFLRRMITWGSLLMGAVALLGILAAPVLVDLQAPGQGAEARKTTIGLLRCFFLLPALYCPNVFLNQTLLSLDNFVVPGLTKTVENLGKVVFMLLFFGRLGVYAIPLGWAAGAVVQGWLLYRALRPHGFKYRPALRFRDPHLLATLRQSGPAMVGHVSSLGVEVLQNALTSFLGPGSLSALRLATRIIDSFSGLLVNSVVTAATPTVTRSLARGDFDQMKRDMVGGVRLLLQIGLPACVWLVLLCQPMIALLFQRLNFSAADTELVGSLLVLMIPYVLLSRLFGLAELGFYGNCDSRTPLVAQLSLAAVYAGLMALLARPYEVFGFPVARSAAYLLAVLLIFALLHRRYGRFPWRDIKDDFLKIASASFLMALLIVIGNHVVHSFALTGLPQRFAALGLPSLLGAAGFLGACLWLKVIPPAWWERLFLRFGIRR